MEVSSQAIVVLAVCFTIFIAAVVGALAWVAVTVLAQGRVALDATAQAIRLQALIDQRVAERTMNVQIGPDGKVTPIAGRRGRLPEQPPDPSVRQSSVVDDVHELERETSRLMNPDLYSKRDTFSQPLAFEEA